MPRVPLASLVGASYPASSVLASAEKTVNLYPEAIETRNSKSPFPYCLLPTPGFTLFATTPVTPGRGLFSGVEGRLFAIGGDTFYEILSDGTVTSRGSVALGGTPTFAYNGAAGAQVGIASGSNFYIFNTGTNVFTQVAAMNGLATQVAYLNNRFLALDVTNNKFRVSALSDGTTWPGAGVSSRSAQADGWQALLVSHGLMWLIGSRTTDVYYDAGVDADQPFVPDPSGFLQYGTPAGSSVAELDNAPIWLQQTKDGGPMLARAEGYTVKRISHHAFEHAVQGYATISDAGAFTYQQDGHSFYVLNFPTAQASWAYDAATGMLCERGFWSPTQNAYRVYRANAHAYAYGKHLMSDRQSGGIYQASTSVATEMDGTGIRRLRRAPLPAGDNSRVMYNNLELLLDAGSGTVSGQGSDPQILLRLSRDGGRTWGNEHWQDAGMLGAYLTRTQWARLGMARDNLGMVELVLSDPAIGSSKWMQAFVDVTPGTN